MGMYNSIYLRCPECWGLSKELQSKEGGCTLKTLVVSNEEPWLEPDIAEDLDGIHTDCADCGKGLQYHAPKPQVVIEVTW